MKIISDNQEYILDLPAAIKAGAAKPVPKPIHLENLKKGDVFRFANIILGVREDWSTRLFLMVRPGLSDVGQSLWLKSDGKAATQTYFLPDSRTVYCVLQDDGTWKETI